MKCCDVCRNLGKTHGLGDKSRKSDSDGRERYGSSTWKLARWRIVTDAETVSPKRPDIEELQEKDENRTNRT